MEGSGRFIPLSENLAATKSPPAAEPFFAMLLLRFGDIRLEFPAICADEMEEVGDWMRIMLSIMTRSAKCT